MAEQVKTRITEDELIRMGDAWVEVVDGELVEIDTNTMTLLHAIVIDNLAEILRPVIRANKLGLVHGDGLKYILAVDERGVQTAYIPDLAFVRKARIPPDSDLNRLIHGAPDLAVEVQSPGQATSDLLDKAADYLKYGAEEVWIIYPVKRELHRYRRGEEPPEVYTETQSVQAETLFPGLSIKIADLFVVE